MVEKFHSMSNNCVNLENFILSENYPNIKDVIKQSEMLPERTGNTKAQPSIDSSSEDNALYESATCSDARKKPRE